MIKKFFISVIGLFAIGCSSSMQRVVLMDNACSIKMPTDMTKRQDVKGWVYVNPSKTFYVDISRNISDGFQNLSAYAEYWQKTYSTFAFTKKNAVQINGLSAEYYYFNDDDARGSFVFIDAETHYYRICVAYSEANSDVKQKELVDKIIYSFKIEKENSTKSNEIMQEQESSNLYDFTYRDIPYLANEVYTSKLSIAALGDKEWIMEAANNASFSWDSFDVQNILISSVCMILYTFPEPQKSPDAKFAMLTIDIEKKDFISYYTLEKMDNNGWLLGGIDIIGQMQNDKLNHLNFGQVQYAPTLENFMYDVFTRLSTNKKLSFLAHAKRCPIGHFYHKSKKECPHCIADRKVKEQASIYRNALLDAYSSAYTKEEIQKIADLDGLVGQYGYIFSKASKFLLNGADEYKYNDYFHYPLVEWNQEKLKNGCEQWVKAKGVTEQQCLKNLTKNEIRDLFELFHYTLINTEPTLKDGVSKVTFQHKMSENKCFIFCQFKP